MNAADAMRLRFAASRRPDPNVKRIKPLSPLRPYRCVSPECGGLWTVWRSSPLACCPRCKHVGTLKRIAVIHYTYVWSRGPVWAGVFADDFYPHDKGKKLELGCARSKKGFIEGPSSVNYPKHRSRDIRVVTCADCLVDYGIDPTLPRRSLRGTAARKQR